MTKLTRGFKGVRKKINETKGNLRCVRNCTTCQDFFGVDGGEEECHNTGVTSFDMTVEDTKQYCTYWKPLGTKKE